MNRHVCPATLLSIVALTVAAGWLSGLRAAEPATLPSAGPKLPWSKPEAEPQAEDEEIAPPTRRLSNARELLELYNIDASQIAKLVDGQPLVSEEEETLHKILYRLPFFGREKVEAWATPGVTWAELTQHPQQHRLGVFPLEGRAIRIERVALISELATRFEYDHYFRVQLRLPDAPAPVLICSRAVPEAWKTRETLDERASCYGLFLKSAQSDQGPATLIFAADRIAWHPDREEPAAGITADQVLLGDLRVDVGTFDPVRRTNRKGLGPDDRECFYQLLAATTRAAPAELLARASRTFDIATMLTEPETQQGRLLTVIGNARRVQRVAVGEEDIRQRFGIDHYYQIDMFVPLGDQEVRLGPKTAGQDAPVFQNSYPVTCCVLHLPPDLPAEDNISEQVRVTGFFFKLWAYRTEYVSSFNDKLPQLGPLLIATTPTVIELDRGTNPLWGWLIAATVLVVFGYVLVNMWLSPRRDRRVAEALRGSPPPGQQNFLRDLDAEFPTKPDFSGLETGEEPKD